MLRKLQDPILRLLLPCNISA
ncbi:RepA leader peptide Tap, partial [Salmonella enterica subsp. enterica serovar Chester]